MNKIIRLLIVFAILFSLFLGLLEVIGRIDIACKSYSCVKVQTSSFSKIFSVPIPFFAAFILLLSLLTFHKKKLSLFFISFLVGAESYLTFLEGIYIKSFCKICLVFFSIILVILALLIKENPLLSILSIIFSFLFAHFLFFFPYVKNIPWLLEYTGKSNRIELFFSFSCPHCEEAERFLVNFTEKKPIDLILRPVSLSSKDREKALDILSHGSPLLKRIGDRILWDNEKKLIEKTGSVAVPVIIMVRDGEEKIIKGWENNTSSIIESFFSESPFSIPIPSLEGGVCTGEAPCR